MASIAENKKDGKTVSYRFRTCVGRDEFGRQVIRSVTWKKPEGLSQSRLNSAVQRAAAEWEKEAKLEYSMELLIPSTDKGKPKESKGLSLSSFITDEWFPLRIDNGERKPKTVSFYTDTMKNITAYFGDRSIADITARELQGFLNYLRCERGMAPQTVHHHYRTLRMVFAYAQRQEVIHRNPADKLDPPRLERGRVNALTKEETIKLFRVLESCPLDFQCILTLFITTGLRRGELLGLMWSDVDFENRTVSVQRNVTYTSASGIVVSTPKTAKSLRTIPLLDSAVDMLRKYRADGLSDGFLFHSEDGSPRDPSAVTRRIKRFMKANGLPDMSPHDLRHTCATLLLQNGADIKSVQELMGHTDAGTTLNFYARSDLEQMRAAASCMESMVTPKQSIGGKG